MNVPKLQHGTECINKLDIKQRRVRTMRREVDSSLILHQRHGGVTSSQSHNLSDPQFYYLTQSTNSLDNLNFWGGESKRKERQTCKNYNELTQEEFPSKGRVWTRVQKKGNLEREGKMLPGKSRGKRWAGMSGFFVSGMARDCPVQRQNGLYFWLKESRIKRNLWDNSE